MSSFDEYYEAIDEIKECLTKDLFGVSSEDEILENVEPLSAYVTGILYPRKASQNNSFNHQIALFDSEESELIAEDNILLENTLDSLDDTITEANNYRPSSMGISVMVPPSLKKLLVTFDFGIYKHSESKRKIPSSGTIEEQGQLTLGELSEKNIKEITDHKYTRIPKSINLTFNIPSELGGESIAYNDDFNAEINLTVRKIMSDGSKLLTVSVVNTATEKNKLHIRNEYALFQCQLSVESDISFLPVYQNLYPKSDIESQIKSLLYQNVKNYAYGHGCSVSYDETKREVFKISSDFIPTEQVLQMMPGKIKNARILSLDTWKNADRKTACNDLNAFIDEYEEWKECKRKEIKSISQFYKAAVELINRIEICIKRLRTGVDVLKNNDNAWKAFLFMNEAMLLQRVNTKKQKPEQVNWYPFQLAYILQIVPDIVDPKSEFHDDVDLLWFPTGGGKTEAYLGVAAFTIFYRRISGRYVDDGVTVIMRYTLRLLTIQQFERTAAMICACEYLRRFYDIPGGEISIGLWIGSATTPNNLEKANEVLQKLKNNRDEKIYEGNPVQITTCPWCGEKIDITGYSIGPDGMTICCKDNPNCEFHEKLPIYIVDDDIYKQCPTLLLSTIDKFARLAWVEDTKRLFGVEKVPPSLIIQDELHLISGALGSLAGLYEIAVDYLCRKDGISPKIIASTATVKNADEQIRNLYNKKMQQFPPSGISFDDSFFSRIASKDERPARTYIGVCESGGSIADLLVRIYAILTFVKALFIKQGKTDEVIDQYYTVIGYFNAIRDLGASANILQDRIYTHIKTLIERKFQEICTLLGLSERDIPYLYSEELTGRKSAKEIKDTLEHLDFAYNKNGCYSYVLASNMLSVGIDINRLGVMTVYNQPKTNAEYIQATSRVGRSKPGVVIAMYNPMRSRDKSHYEQFGFYHKSFYQYVEATSVTPFSARAMEKALHCVFIALVRLTVPYLSGNDSPAYFQRNDAQVLQIKNFILERVYNLHPKAKDTAECILNEIISEWESITKIYPNLCYDSKQSGNISLLNSAEETSDFDFPPVLNSLRNVEESSNVYIEQ